MVVATGAITIKDELYYNFFYDPNSKEIQAAGCYGFENVALVSIHGGIVNYKIPPENDPAGVYDPDSVAAEEIT